MTVAENLAGLVDEAMTTTERSLYAAEKKIGVSDIGGCHEYVRRLIADEDFTDPRTDYLAAFVGTAMGKELAAAYIKRFPDARAEVPLTVTLRAHGLEINLPGHADIVHGNTITDFKGLALDTRIPTPSGWTTMGTLRIGDKVFDMDGKVASIVAVSDVKNIGCYEVEFAGGHVITCDEEHFWVAQRGFRSTPSVMPVTDLRAGDYVPVASALDMTEADLPLDPWTLGYWLGNGNRCDAMVSCNGEDAVEVSNIATSLGYRAQIRPDKRGANSATVALTGNGFYAAIRALGLKDAKSIPDEYLRASADQRLALLRGLMDSDGSWNHTRKRAVFTNCTRDLSEGVAELARSLGQRVQFSAVMRSGFGLTVESFDVEWTPTVNPFRLSRKRDRVVLASDEGMSHHRLHRVLRVDRVASVPTQCISVDSATATYLAGDAMIPTHNTKNSVRVVKKESEEEDGLLPNKFQLTLYAKALIDSGDLDENATLALAYYDRSGVEQEPFVVEWTYDPDIFRQAEEWLGDVIYALVHSQPASKDPSWAFCESYCAYFTGCRGTDTDVTGLIDDTETLTAIELYVEAAAREKDAKADKAAAAAALKGIAGNTPTHTLRWVTIGESIIKETRRAEHQRIYLMKRKTS